MSTYKLITKSLDDVAPLVCFFPRSVLAGLCDVAGSTLDRYRDDLVQVQPQGFEWTFFGGGYTRDSAECMYQYAQMIKTMRLAIAKQNIKKHMEEFWNERKTNG